MTDQQPHLQKSLLLVLAVIACALLTTGCQAFPGGDGNWTGKNCTTSGSVTVCQFDRGGKHYKAKPSFSTRKGGLFVGVAGAVFSA